MFSQKRFLPRGRIETNADGSTIPDHSIVSYLLLNTSNPIRHKSCDSHHCWPLPGHTGHVGRSCSVQVLSSAKREPSKDIVEIVNSLIAHQRPHHSLVIRPPFQGKLREHNAPQWHRSSYQAIATIDRHFHAKVPKNAVIADARFHVACAPICLSRLGILQRSTQETLLQPKTCLLRKPGPRGYFTKWPAYSTNPTVRCCHPLPKTRGKLRILWPVSTK